MNEIFCFKTNDIEGKNKLVVIDHIDEQPPVIWDKDMDTFVETLLEKYPEDDEFDPSTSNWEPPSIVQEANNILSLYLNPERGKDFLNQQLLFIATAASLLNIHVYSPASEIFLNNNSYLIHKKLFEQITKTNSPKKNHTKLIQGILLLVIGFFLMLTAFWFKTLI